MDDLSNLLTEEETNVEMKNKSDRLEINIGDNDGEEKRKYRHLLCVKVTFLTKIALLIHYDCQYILHNFFSAE